MLVPLRMVYGWGFYLVHLVLATLVCAFFPNGFLGLATLAHAFPIDFSINTLLFKYYLPRLHCSCHICSQRP